MQTNSNSVSRPVGVLSALPLAAKTVQKLSFDLPRRVEGEAESVHEARHEAVKRLGRKWLNHPLYVFNPRHSNDPEVYGPARLAFLTCIAKTAAGDRARNPAFQQAERVRAAVGGAS